MRYLSKIIVVLLVGSIGVASVQAKEDWSKWTTYENKYFRIHSDAKEKQVRTLFEDLEKFRLLTQKALKTKIPQSAKKTDVMLFKKGRDFRQYTASSNIAGFFRVIDGTPLIAMPYKRGGFDAQITIKAGFVYVAQSYDTQKYPKWLRLGLAELLSTVKYHDEYASVGHANKDRWQYLSREINYNRIVEDDFDGIKKRFGADPYAQYWLLTVYSLAHDNGTYRDELANYITEYRKTGNSLESFQTAYGRSPNAFAKEAMRNFGRQSYTYKPLLYKLDLTQQDLEIISNSADADILERYRTVMLNRKKEKEKTRKKK